MPQSQGFKDRSEQSEKEYSEVQFTDPRDQELQALQLRTKEKYNAVVSDFFLAAWELANLIGKTVKRLGPVSQFVAPEINASLDVATVLVVTFGASQGWAVDETIERMNAYSDEADAIITKYARVQSVGDES